MLKIILLCLIFSSFAIKINGKLPSLDRPVVIAHRGASGYLPEHTQAAKVAAFLLNPDYIEQDIVLTRDNVPIVFHDITLDQSTNVAQMFPNRTRTYQGQTRFYAIDLDLHEIKQLSVSERFVPDENNRQKYPMRFPMWQGQFQIHTLEDELQLLHGLESSFHTMNSELTVRDPKLSTFLQKRKPLRLYVEIKRPDFHIAEGKGNMSEIVLAVLNKYNYKGNTDRLILQCFWPPELKRIRTELKSEFILVQLIDFQKMVDNDNKEGTYNVNVSYWTSRKGLEEIKTYANGVGPKLELLIEEINENKVKATEFYTNAKELGLLIHAYTVRIDSLPSFAATTTRLMDIFLNEVKIDGFFTDFPSVILGYIEEAEQQKINHNTTWRIVSSLLLLPIVTGIFYFFHSIVKK